MAGNPPPGGRGWDAPHPGTSSPPACAPLVSISSMDMRQMFAGPQAALQLLHHLVRCLYRGVTALKMAWSCCSGVWPVRAVDVLLLHQGHVVQGAHPDHEELVQVAGEDGGKLEPLHQGDALVLGLLQHPLVEAQPGQLPVLGISGIYFFCHSFYSLSFMWMACDFALVLQGLPQHPGEEIALPHAAGTGG